MSAVYLLVAIALLASLSVGLFRLSSWHQNEADYWNRVALLVRLDVSLDAKYRPVLNWVKANRPSIWARMDSWADPEVRMHRAGVSR